MVTKFKLDSSKSAATKEAITRTLEIANNYAGELAIEVLSLDKIELDPENNRELTLTLSDAMSGINQTDPNYERKKQDWRSLESLAKTIKDDQLINPIYVYRYGNKCRLIAGERRTLASAIAGKNEIIARIASQRPIGTKLRVLQWIENNERSDLSLAERTASLESIIKEYHAENGVNQKKITAQILGDITGMSATQARRYILILQSTAEIRKAIAERKLENIKLIELICSVKKKEHQSELLKAAISGLSFKELLAMKKSIEIVMERKNKTKAMKKNNVNLGRAKPRVIKLIVDALLSCNILENKTAIQIGNICKKTKWDNVASAEKEFKEIVLLLDQGIGGNQ